MGIGADIRDEKGRVAAALSKKIHAPLGAVDAEAKLLKWDCSLLRMLVCVI